MSEAMFRAAKDGTKIPYTISPQGLKPTACAPCISAYCSYGLAALYAGFGGQPALSMPAPSSLRQCTRRRESDREWHKAGQLATSLTRWRDLITVCEDLVAKKYTSPHHLAIVGRSGAAFASAGPCLNCLTCSPRSSTASAGRTRALCGRAERLRRRPEWGAIQRSLWLSGPSRYRQSTNPGEGLHPIPRFY